MKWDTARQEYENSFMYHILLYKSLSNVNLELDIVVIDSSDLSNFINVMLVVENIFRSKGLSCYHLKIK